MSGTRSKRPGLKKAISHLREGDCLVVWKLDRLGRSLKDMIDKVESLGDWGCEFRSLQEAIDTSTSTGKLVFNIFGALAEFERDLIRERTKADLKGEADSGPERPGGAHLRATRHILGDALPTGRARREPAEVATCV